MCVIRLPHFLGRAHQEVQRQFEDVLGPLAQRRHDDADHVEPVVEVLPEPALGDELLEILVRGRNHADVDLDRLRSADRLEAPFLQHAEEFDLRVERDVADFVQEQRPPRSGLKTAHRSR